MSDFTVNQRLSPALQSIADERKRQQDSEGFKTSHDDEYRNDELARAAAVYATPPQWRMYYGRLPAPTGWPWAATWWKPLPHDRRQELVRAGALIAAEIERLDRLAKQTAEELA